MTSCPTDPRLASRLDLASFASRISGEGLSLRIGPFVGHFTVDLPSIHGALYELYGDFPLLDQETVHSFKAKVTGIRRLPRWHRRLVRFSVDGVRPHEDMPSEQALAVLEWGINLVIAMRAHCFLILHSAVLEKSGRALLLPAAPGFGKSTLCAALAHSGWRLLSDEFGLVRPGSTDFIPFPRPIALKNESIDVFRQFAPDAYLGPPVPNTRKGTVAHVKPPADCVYRQAEPVSAHWIVFPRWQKGADTEFGRMSKSEGFMTLATNAFNYEMLGESGFATVADVIARSECFRFQYSNLDEAIRCLDRLAENDGTSLA